MADRVLLIHGAWQGAWAWERFLPLLWEAGFGAEAVDLPGNGTDATPPEAVSLQLYVEHLRQRIAGDRVRLVAHSGGGIVASQVAEAMPERIAGIAYVAGMMLPDGTGFADLSTEAPGVGPHLVWSEDRLTSTVPAPVALRCFFHDCAPDLAAAAAVRLSPQPERGRAVRPRLSPERFGRVPRLYVEATEDRAVAPALQRRMQALVPGAAVERIAVGHAPQLAAPDRLAAAVLPWLRA